jgi:hypothetical protein
MAHGKGTTDLEWVRMVLERYRFLDEVGALLQQAKLMDAQCLCVGQMLAADGKITPRRCEYIRRKSTDERP